MSEMEMVTARNGAHADCLGPSSAAKISGHWAGCRFPVATPYYVHKLGIFERSTDIFSESEGCPNSPSLPKSALLAQLDMAWYQHQLWPKWVGIWGWEFWSAKKKWSVATFSLWPALLVSYACSMANGQVVLGKKRNCLLREPQPVWKYSVTLLTVSLEERVKLGWLPVTGELLCTGSRSSSPLGPWVQRNASWLGMLRRSLWGRQRHPLSTSWSRTS